MVEEAEADRRRRRRNFHSRLKGRGEALFAFKTAQLRANRKSPSPGKVRKQGSLFPLIEIGPLSHPPVTRRNPLIKEDSRVPLIKVDSPVIGILNGTGLDADESLVEVLADRALI